MNGALVTGELKKRGRFGSSGIARPDPDFPCFSIFRFYCAIYHLVSFCLTECLELAKDIRAHAESSKTT